MLPTTEEQKIADLTTEREELLDLLSAAFGQLNAYWQGDFEGRPIARLMHERLTAAGRIKPSETEAATEDYRATHCIDCDQPNADCHCQIPSIFETDEDGEATGTVHSFCSEDCRNASPLPCGERTVFGLSFLNFFAEGQLCETCGKAL